MQRLQQNRLDDMSERFTGRDIDTVSNINWIIVRSNLGRKRRENELMAVVEIGIITMVIGQFFD